MTTPSSSLKVTQTKQKKKLRYNPHPKKQEEKQNIFGHLSEALGMQTLKLAKGQVSLLEKLKKIIVSLSIFMAIGFVLGLILEMFIQVPYPLSSILALTFFLIWLLRNGRKYI
jgi:hypothetical protein